ncbi:serine/threonine protein kinase [Hyalangium gracile]|uniref:serine/threonine protein kinase n=1 Tax=Hyalangium gracile TaxID=394092 RepID=UPI001CCCD8E1|nr:serine/threonine-protein kinase [Hyalangium gracile]
MGAPGKGAPVGPSDDFHRGEQIGKYQVITQLSVGGMAELFLGFTAGPGGFRKYVALKRILPDVRSNEAFRRMFLDEARITAAFNHPNIAQVYELGQEEEGLYLAMEFIAGQNLDQLTNAYRRRQEPIPLGLSLALMRDVCLALHYAHTFTDPSGRPSPIVHRDVAQKNIMVTYDGVVKLLDFGIAKARNSLERTRAGMVKGTAGYMSPEQVRGEPLDGRSDVFAVGVVLWELVTGSRLFAAKTEREEMASILTTPVPVPEHPTTPVSEALAAVILQALERDVKRRFQSAKELARALEQAAGGQLFDTDQRAAVMRELFEKKMTATRSLLESADAAVGTDPEAEGEPAPEPPRKKAPPPPPPAPIRSGRTEVYVDKSAPATEEKASNVKVDSGLNEEVRIPDTRVAPATTQDAASGGGRTLNTVLWVAVLMSVVLGGGYLVLTLTRSLNEDLPPQPALQTYADPRLRTFPEPGQPVPPSAAGDAGAAAGTTAVVEAKGPEAKGAQEEKSPPSGGEDKPSKSRRTPEGKMTLIINPEAQVFLGKRSLGKTPLFNAPVPVGRNRLRIVGPDKKQRWLPVVIEEGKTTMHRFDLDNIPEAP